MLLVDDASARRDLIPKQPSVEMNLEVLRQLPASSYSSHAPFSVGQSPTAVAPTARQPQPSGAVYGGVQPGLQPTHRTMPSAPSSYQPAAGYQGYQQPMLPPPPLPTGAMAQPVYTQQPVQPMQPQPVYTQQPVQPTYTPPPMQPAVRVPAAPAVATTVSGRKVPVYNQGYVGRQTYAGRTPSVPANQIHSAQPVYASPYGAAPAYAAPNYNAQAAYQPTGWGSPAAPVAAKPAPARSYSKPKTSPVPVVKKPEKPTTETTAVTPAKTSQVLTPPADMLADDMTPPPITKTPDLPPSLPSIAPLGSGNGKTDPFAAMPDMGGLPSIDKLADSAAPVDSAPANLPPADLPEPDLGNMKFDDFPALEPAQGSAVPSLPPVSMPAMSDGMPASTMPASTMPDMPSVDMPSTPMPSGLPDIGALNDGTPIGASGSEPQPLYPSNLPSLPMDLPPVPELSANAPATNAPSDQPPAPSLNDIPPMMPPADGKAPFSLPDMSGNDAPTMPAIPGFGTPDIPPMSAPEPLKPVETEMAALPDATAPALPVPSASGESLLSIPFAETENEIPVNMQGSLTDLARQLTQSGREITIRPYVRDSGASGHTAQAIGTSRAFSVRTYLLDLGVDVKNISVANPVTLESGGERVDVVAK